MSLIDNVDVLRSARRRLGEHDARNPLAPVLRLPPNAAGGPGEPRPKCRLPQTLCINGRVGPKVPETSRDAETVVPVVGRCFGQDKNLPKPLESRDDRSRRRFDRPGDIVPALNKRGHHRDRMNHIAD